MSRLIQVLIGGVTLGSIYLLVATGINIVFGQTRIVNFAHGQFLVIAGLLSWELTSNGTPFVVALIVSVLVISVLAWVIEIVLLRRVRDSPLASFLLTLGVLLILTQLTINRYTSLPHQLQSPIDGRISAGGVSIGYASVLVIALSLLTALGFFAALRFLRVGRMVKASAEDPLASRHVGIPVTRVASLTFVVGSALAAWAGCLLGVLYPIAADSGGSYLIKGFSVALLGGLGSVSGGVIAAFILGIAEQLSAAYWDASWVPGLAGLLIIVVLLVRPSGLFGKVEGSTEARESFLPPPVPMPKWSPLLSAAALVGAFFVPSLGLSYEARSLAAFAVMYAIQAVAVGFLFRVTGILSFGHGAFYALGAYGSALAVMHLGYSFWLLIPMTAVASGVLGLLVGIPILRLRGFYFVIVSFAIADLMTLAIINEDGLTGGTNGLTVIDSPPSILGQDFSTATGLYQLLVGFLIVAMLVVWAVERSRFGRRLAALRENPALARSLGLQIHSHQVLAFGISAAISGVGGVLFFYENAALSPPSFTGFATVAIPLMVILGGSRIPAGPLIGAVVLTFLPFWLNFGPHGTQYAQGIALIVLMIAMPEGLGPGAVQLVRRGGRLIGLWNVTTPRTGESDLSVDEPVGPGTSRDVVSSTTPDFEASIITRE